MNDELLNEKNFDQKVDVHKLIVCNLKISIKNNVLLTAIINSTIDKKYEHLSAIDLEEKKSEIFKEFDDISSKYLSDIVDQLKV